MRYAAYGGHGSWVVLVVFVAALLGRLAASNRRKSGGPPPRARTPGSASSLTGPAGPSAAPPAAGPVGAPPAPPVGDRAIGASGIAPGWLVDPSGRHEARYWSGRQWTEHVSDGGVPGTDPPPGMPEMPPESHEPIEPE